MTPISKKVDVSVHISQNKNFELSGRFLGLITTEQYAKLFEDPKLMAKLFCVATKPIGAISKMATLNEERLVVALKKINGKDVNENTLFFSEPLDVISEFRNINEISLSGTDSFICVKEREEV
jgi:hypothetical protein